MAPSPSRTTSWESVCAKEVRVSCIARPSSDVGEVIGDPPAAPLARSATVSLVDVSPSILMELKERSTAWVRSGWRVEAGMGASVVMIPSRVAMLGWIMPAPFAMPAREYVVPGEEGRVNVVERSLGKVSVVQIARAVVSQAEWVGERVECAVGILERILVMGRR